MPARLTASHRSLLVLLLLAMVSVIGCRPAGTQLPAPVQVAAGAVSPTPPPIPTRLATTAAPTDRPQPTATRTLTPTPPPTRTSTPRPSVTPSPTHTLTPTLTPTATNTPVPTSTPLRATIVAADQAYPQAAIDPSQLEIGIEEVVGGLNQPTGVIHAPAGDALYITERQGRVRIVWNGFILEPPMLDISHKVESGFGEQGLLGMAFHPDFEENDTIYLYYTDKLQHSILSSWTVLPEDRNRIDPESEVVLLQQDQPAKAHNAGQILFGPDGYLYLGLGDGGGIGGEFVRDRIGQTLLGTIIRIDVDGGTPYAIPPDNPFVDDLTMRDEIWHYGLRNPWRFTIDEETGAMFIGDVGELTHEELDFALAGQSGLNFGWPFLEGSTCFDGQPCNPALFTPPIAEHGRDLGCAIVSGRVYRGQDYPFMRGIFFFADYCTGRLWAMHRVNGDWQKTFMGELRIPPTSFGEDRDGELYLTDFLNGRLFRLTAHQR